MTIGQFVGVENDVLIFDMTWDMSENGIATQAQTHIRGQCKWMISLGQSGLELVILITAGTICEH